MSYNISVTRKLSFIFKNFVNLLIAENIGDEIKP
jgi:hypothetical protein